LVNRADVFAAILAKGFYEMAADETTGACNKDSFIFVDVCFNRCLGLFVLFTFESNPPTGGPNAGNPLVRFGGRGEASCVPTPIRREPLETNVLTVKAAEHPNNSISALREGAAEWVTCLIGRETSSDLTNSPVQHHEIPAVATAKAIRWKNLICLFSSFHSVRPLRISPSLVFVMGFLMLIVPMYDADEYYRGWDAALGSKACNLLPSASFAGDSWHQTSGMLRSACALVGRMAVVYINNQARINRLPASGRLTAQLPQRDTNAGVRKLRS